VFNHCAWTWNDKRQQYYFHQFDPSQPDLNFHNPKVVEEMDVSLVLGSLLLIDSLLESTAVLVGLWSRRIQSRRNTVLGRTQRLARRASVTPSRPQTDRLRVPRPHLLQRPARVVPDDAPLEDLTRRLHPQARRHR
jgi:hypothetical protein